ncbi:MAG: TolC family protein [Bacteroidetes bacterium]|nr:TolC family protein [Bacteroidota bacterium]
MVFSRLRKHHLIRIKKKIRLKFPYIVSSFCLIFLISASLSAFAQTKVWSLKECIDYALANNLQVRQQVLTVRSVKEGYSQSRMNRFPSLYSSSNYGLSSGKTVDPYSYEFTTENIQSGSFGLNAQVTLFNGLQALNTIRQNKFLYMAAMSDADRMRDEISLTIAQSYMQILFNEELLEIAKQQHLTIKQQVEQTRKMVEAGGLAPGNLLDVEAQEALEALNVVNALNQLDLSYLQLVQLLEIDSADGFIIEKPVTNNPDTGILSLSPLQIFNLAVSSRPEIKSAEYNLESSIKGLAAAKGSRYPQLTLSGSIGSGYSDQQKKISGISITGYDTIGYTVTAPEPVIAPTYSYSFDNIPFGRQFDDNLNQSVRLNLSIPLFTNWQVKTAVTKAKIVAEQAQYNLLIARKELFKTISRAHADAKAAMLRYRASEKAAKAMSESFKYTGEKFNIGMATSFEYNQAKTKLGKMQSDLLQAKYDLIFKIKLLDFYRGKSLGF